MKAVGQTFKLVQVMRIAKEIAKNFGVIRKQATPSTGTALLTFSSINATININKGDVIMISNIDRAFRNVEVAEEALRDCEARGISVVVTDFFKDDHSVYQLIVDGESNVIFPEGSPLPATKAREMVLEFLKSSAWEKSKQQGVYTSMQAYMENFLDNTELRAACKPVFDAILGGNNVVICPRVSTVSLNFFISFI